MKAEGKDIKKEGTKGMYKYFLAVCEDDKLIMENICRICENTLTDMGIDYEIRRFLSAEHLEETLGRKGQIFDLLILDIELEKKTGMELARELRAKGDRVSAFAERKQKTASAS